MRRPDCQSAPPGSCVVRIHQGFLLAGVVLLIGLTGCRTEMYDQPRYDTFEPSDFFPDGISARPLVAGTVPRGWSREDEHLHYGRSDGALVTTFPFEVDLDVLERGRDQYNVFCSPCHGGLGDGEGMVVQRGMPKPPSFHEERLREAPVGHLYDVISRGYGAMYAYDHRIKPRDRWAVVAYVKALQFSQHAPESELEVADLDRLAQPEEAAR